MSLAETLIKKSLKTKEPVLDLGNCGLDGTEKELELLAACEHVEVLNFSNQWVRLHDKSSVARWEFSNNKGKPNVLSCLPLALPSHLKILIAEGDYNQPWNIRNLHPLVGLTQLERLYLGNNRIVSPKVLKNLTQLTHLDLGQNQIADLEPLAELRCLKELFLDTNRIDNIEALSGLTQLTKLSLRQNRIANIQALKKLTQLEVLYLGTNLVVDVEPLTALLQLEYIDLDGNLIEKVSLEFIEALPRLHQFNLGRNHIENIPEEILSENPEGIKNYLRSIKAKEDRRELNEAKLIFVGVGEVGKTELADALSKEDYEFDPYRETTEGIRIKQWQPECYRDNERVDFTANIWDFAGQEINYGTHQFFLTKHSIYIFVWDSRKNEDQSKFNYWLNIVSLLSANAPVLVVQNKVDVYKEQLNQANWLDAFPNIVDFYETSCKTGEGIAALRERAVKELLDLPNTREIWNKHRVAVREALETHPADHISYREYLKICEQHQVNSEDARYLGQQLHHIGVILHFRDEFALKDTVVLKPEWATDAAYALLGSTEARTGSFTTDQLGDIWHEPRFDAKHVFLLDMMKRFELVFQLNDSHQYIVPGRLPIEPLPGAKAIVAQDDDALHLRFEYHYYFMPKGIFSRFICRVHTFISDQLFWRHGVILMHKGSKAMVTLNDVPAIKKIKIDIWGNEASNLLSIIRRDFEHIHTQLRHPPFDEIIPCHCEQCQASGNPHHFKTTLLDVHQQKNIPALCHHGTVIEVADLLHGIARPNASYLKQLINEHQIAAFFEETDKLNINDNMLSQLRQRFVKDDMSHNFADQLKTWVSAWFGGKGN